MKNFSGFHSTPRKRDADSRRSCLDNPAKSALPFAMLNGISASLSEVQVLPYLARLFPKRHSTPKPRDCMYGDVHLAGTKSGASASTGLECSDRTNEIDGLKRFRDVLVVSGSHCVLEVTGSRGRRDSNRGKTVLLMLEFTIAQLVNQDIAILLWHSEVGQQNIGSVSVNDVERTGNR